ncbi:major histocompatibility complex class I-related gene protein-like isoform X2 [Antennarius striatus]|uniref:major histocompatibility complex class I-related gene protein-like isoform X2 n=1 Tax=Antennarius striatus TaxID=241820 RepID=UPI0035AFEF5C
MFTHVGSEFCPSRGRPLLVHGRHRTSATHSLKYLYTVSSGVPNIPEFVVVGLIDDVQIVGYDSNTKRLEPKQNWMEKVTADVPDYWNQQTRTFVLEQEMFKVDINFLKKRLKQSEGFHIVQRTYGCEWDDETGEVTGFHWYGHNGEDFLILDLKTETWIAPRPEAVVTKHKWDQNKDMTKYWKHYLTQQCPEWGRKFWEYGKSFLLRTELPSVFLLQKTPSSPVSCFATGFYPKAAALFWRRDEEELYEEVDHGEILPNHDGTFQMRVDLNVSSVAPEDWRRYDCVFQLQGVEDDLVTRLDKGKIRTNWGKTGNPFSSVDEPTDVTATTIIIIFIAATVLAFVLMVAVEVKPSRQRTAQRRPLPEDRPELPKRLKMGDAIQPEVSTTTTG